MDERLEAGRHHLTNGSRALDQGYPDDARAFYRAALLQFRGPELRLGEAHALRGLARVDLVQGFDATAAEYAAAAIRAYEDLIGHLAEIDPEGVSDEIRRSACEGESAAEVLAAELSARAGDGPAARDHLDRARALAMSVRAVPLQADGEAALGRLALRQGRYADAEGHFQHAVSAQQEAAQPAAEAGAHLLLAEARRLRGDAGGARDALDDAAEVAGALRSDRLAGRVAWARAALDLGEGDLALARVGFEAAVPVLLRAGDFEMHAHALLGLAEVISRQGQAGARERLLEAARRLGTAGDPHGVATALLVAAEHALRVGRADVATALGEGARRLWSRTDPVRGVGQALRLLARAGWAAHRPDTALWAALTRELVAGRDQPRAADVAAWLRERAPEHEAATAASATADELRRRVEAALRRDVEPLLAPLGLAVEGLDRSDGALAVMSALVATLPDEAAAPPIASGPPADEEQPTGAFVALGALRAGKGGTLPPAPARGAYPPRSEGER